MLGIAGLATSWWSLSLLIGVAGAGNALTQPAANVLMARTVPPQRHGIAFAVKQSAMPFGTLLGGLAVPVVTLTLGWRWAFAMGGALALGAATTVPQTDRRVDDARPADEAPRPTRPRLDTPLLLLAVFAVGVGLGAAVASAPLASSASEVREGAARASWRSQRVGFGRSHRSSRFTRAWRWAAAKRSPAGGQMSSGAGSPNSVR